MGLQRLGRLQCDRLARDGTELHAHVLEPVRFLPAAGQGAIAIECRAGDSASIVRVRALNHADTEARVTAEREFLRLLGAGCQTPVGARTWIEAGTLHMAVRVFNEADLSAPPVEKQACHPVAEPRQLAAELARGLEKGVA